MNKEAIKHLPASKFELKAYKFIFVTKLDFSHQNGIDSSGDVCPICVERFNDGDE
jgi:hypothetical protein